MSTSKFTVNAFKGAIPEQGTEWWTEEDWKRHDENVKKLKEEGTYLDPVTYTMEISDFPEFNDPAPKKTEWTGLLIDQENGTIEKTILK